MSVQINKKYKISLRADSPKGKLDGNGMKTQGLRIGDIVRRQYFDGSNTIYTLMCVVDCGVDTVINNGIEKTAPWFVGVLLEGSAPKEGELLDFVRVTSLFDTSRSGALYLTASDNNSPYLDVIDGIGKNNSLTWPESLATQTAPDPQSQYVVISNSCIVNYSDQNGDRKRVCQIQKSAGGVATLKQSFTQFVNNPNEVIVSFWAKSTQSFEANVSVGYDDGSKIDGNTTILLSTEWQYHICRVVVDYSGRFRRAVSIDFAQLPEGELVYIADFNAILLSSLSQYNDASHVRVGKLNGLSDPVFGQLDSYGGYFQKLFASNSVHVSGTLTAGDANGFGATFYAGKIHKNVCINSLSPTVMGTLISERDLSFDYDTVNPTGVGNVYGFDSLFNLHFQTIDWLKSSDNIGKTYTFSFWIYAQEAYKATVYQNGNQIGGFTIPSSEVFQWVRKSITFKLNKANNRDNTAVLQINTTTALPNTSRELILFTAPQVELGEFATQYQPTDEVVTPQSEGYGAWFNRGGIGGTIQNPLLKLNADGNGSIETKDGSIKFKQDGSGQIAKGNIRWDADGTTHIGKDVKFSWENFSNDAKDELSPKSIKIIGPTTFTMISGNEGIVSAPNIITLTVESNGFSDSAPIYNWYYLKGEEWLLAEANSITFNVGPNEALWRKSNTLTIKCIASLGLKSWTDTVTLTKFFADGYRVDIESSNGTSFLNHECKTVLRAKVFSQGEPIKESEYQSTHQLYWTKYDIVDGALVEDASFWNQADAPASRYGAEILLNCKISGTTRFSCELLTLNSSFPYSFPISF